VIYVALLRARRTLIVAALAYAVIVAVVVVSFLTNHVTMQTARDPRAIPDSMFAVAAFVGALIVASVTATSLNREGPTLPIAWTKPLSRRRIALEYFAVDLAALAGVALLTVVAGILIALPADVLRHVVHDPKLGELVFRSAGVVVMWYAVVQAASAGLSGRGGAVIGLSWPVFGGLLGLATVWQIPGLHGLALALNVFNPLAWLSSTTRVAHGAAVSTTSSLFPFLPHAVVVVAPWLLAGLALYLATVLWSRREA
jgi:hypothetical protein